MKLIFGFRGAWGGARSKSVCVDRSPLLPSLNRDNLLGYNPKWRGYGRDESALWPANSLYALFCLEIAVAAAAAESSVSVEK